MNVTSGLQNFLQQLEILKAQLLALNFKPTQANAREGMINMTRTFMTECNLSVLAIDDLIIRDKYPIPIRIYNPNPMEKLPVAVFIHGGGHMCGSITVYDGIVRKLTKSINHIVVAIDYRLAPEFPYPTGLDDCRYAIQNMFKILDERKINYTNQDITLIGDSGGAAFSASLVMDKNFVDSCKVKKQVMFYPATDYLLNSPTTKEFATGYLLETKKVAWYYDNYFQNNENRKEKSPLHNEFYKGMPETLVIVASHDILRAEGEMYYQKVKDVGNNAKLVVIDGVIHAYLMLENLCKDECNTTYKEVANFLN